MSGASEALFLPLLGPVPSRRQISLQKGPVWFGSGEECVTPRGEQCALKGLTSPPCCAPVFENSSKIVIVMEYASRGDLYDYISERQRLSEQDARHFFRQIVSAVHYCHQVRAPLPGPTLTGGPWGSGTGLRQTESMTCLGSRRETEAEAKLNLDSGAWGRWRLWLWLLGVKGSVTRRTVFPQNPQPTHAPPTWPPLCLPHFPD